jgi:hypothetical protein
VNTLHHSMSSINCHNGNTFMILLLSYSSHVHRSTNSLNLTSENARKAIDQYPEMLMSLTQFANQLQYQNANSRRRTDEDGLLDIGCNLTKLTKWFHIDNMYTNANRSNTNGTL